MAALAVRVVREGLTNAVKHAAAAPVEVSTAPREGGLDVVVRTRDVPGRSSAPGGGHGLKALAADVADLGGTLEHGRVADDHLLAVRLPACPADAAGPPTVESARRTAVGAVRRSRSTAVRGIAAAFAISVLLVAGYRVADAATSVLPTATVDALTSGTARTAVERDLPLRTRTDGTGISGPPGAWCEYYSVSADPLSTDLHQLCWSGGRLVGKDLVVRSGTDPWTIGT
ncbi:hypothetical protein DI005_06425 [Prauserella sp. PE36]|uniref:ATP-binding protein n=1 Tax=Prauserella sp. PE36 TaxID=1504709 RepID=UPI000DE4F803|nr:hypothetical protein [Prauserella sp. PE36]RBM22452.1 hypothetical protein DI005_06425 [Prauserella sp. PE36]